MEKFYLVPTDGRKSFYNKAVVIESNGSKTLYSYNTPVCRINRRGRVQRLWDGESSTTMRHVNAFLDYYGKDGGGVYWWRALPVEKVNGIKEMTYRENPFKVSLAYS